jgi:hypothetical protein
VEVTLSAYIGDGRFGPTRGDVDIYELEVGEGDVVVVDVDAAAWGSELDSLIVVFDYLGQVLAANDNDGLTTDSLLVIEAVLPTPDNPPPNGPPATLYVMVMGTRQVRPPDPLVPNPGQPNEVRMAEHIVTGASSSTGPYDVTFAFYNNNCCTTDHGPGCNVSEIEACVCEIDPYCCEVEWDEFCVEEVTSFGCGYCGTGIGFREDQGNPLPRSQPRPQRIFATTYDVPANGIVELDPTDGSVISRFKVPEEIVTAGQGLAVWDDTLFYLGAGRFPKLYWLEPETGDASSEMTLWSGSGYYGDLALLNGRIFVTDIGQSSVHELDPQTLQAVRTIDVGPINGITLFGPIASLACPDWLYVADAGSSNNCCDTNHGPGCSDTGIAACVCQIEPDCCTYDWDSYCVDIMWASGCGNCGTDPGGIHSIDAATGEAGGSMSAGVSCPCSADFDGDGDVDDDDWEFLYECSSDVPYGCQPADLDCNGVIDGDDEAILACQENGPGQPPNQGCCPPGLPPVRIWASALGGSGNARLYVNDWHRESIEVFDQGGTLLDTFAMGSRVGAIGGEPVVSFGDSDGDGLVGLDDFAAFMGCLTGPGDDPVGPGCCMFDAEPDGDADLDDFAAFQIAFSQGV